MTIYLYSDGIAQKMRTIEIADKKVIVNKETFEKKKQILQYLPPKIL